MATVYNGYKTKGFEGDSSLTIKAMLLDSNYTIDADLDVYRDDISADEVSGTNYTAGGVALTSVSTNQDNAGDKGQLLADDPTFTNLTVSDIKTIVYYVDSGLASTDLLICAQTFASAENRTAADFIVNLDSGILVEAS